jgi:hypothetical protein
MVSLVSGIEEEVSEEQLATMKDENKDKEEDKDKPDRSKANGHGAFVVDDWMQARIGWFPRPKTGPDMPMVTSLRGRQLPFQRYFDDYYNGPMLTDLYPIPQAIMGYDASLVYLANQITLTPWTLFKDYGYRLLLNFTQNFIWGNLPCSRNTYVPSGCLTLQIQSWHTMASVLEEMVQWSIPTTCFTWVRKSSWHWPTRTLMTQSF